MFSPIQNGSIFDLVMLFGMGATLGVCIAAVYFLIIAETGLSPDAKAGENLLKLLKRSKLSAGIHSIRLYIAGRISPRH